jgi:16S rRNA processing protein RimM
VDVGRVLKAHGLAGEVVVDLWSPITERLAPGSVLETDGGRLVVQRSRPHQGRHLVFFEGVTDRHGAEALRGTALRAVATEVVDTAGAVLGVVEAVEANPASDLLVLDGGRLVPLRFVVEHTSGARIIVDIPDGLFD